MCATTISICMVDLMSTIIETRNSDQEYVEIKNKPTTWENITKILGLWDMRRWDSSL